MSGSGSVLKQSLNRVRGGGPAYNRFISDAKARGSSQVQRAWDTEQEPGQPCLSIHHISCQKINSRQIKILMLKMVKIATLLKKYRLFYDT